MVRQNAYIVGYDALDEDGTETVSTAEVAGNLDIIEEAISVQEIPALREFEEKNNTEVWLYHLVPFKRVSDES